MKKSHDLRFGCAASGALHRDNAAPDIATKVQIIKEAGVFDYIDCSPFGEDFKKLLTASEKYGLPVRCGGWFYAAGRDESIFEINIVTARLLGAEVHNVQLESNHADGHPLSNAEVADFYLRAYDFGCRHGVVPCFEVHVNMWSEHAGRIEQVAELVRERGIPFYMTLDHSHVIFKIDNPQEQSVQGMNVDIDAGHLILDPLKQGNVIRKWISQNLVRHAHARCAVPANPVNSRATHPDGSFGRGIQYPFVRPGPGEYVNDDWEPERMEPWKQGIRDLFSYHATHEMSPLRQISCEYIPAVDYGAGHGYSIFEQNVACAQWLRAEWARAVEAGGLAHPLDE